MTAVYQRLGMTPRSRIYRLAKPLRVEENLLGHVGFSWVRKPLAYAGDLILRFLETTPASALTFIEHYERFGEEFTVLMGELGKRYTATTYRSATYLNWRYKDHPLRQHRVITARTNKGELVGYLVLYRDGDIATIADLVIAGEDDILQGLIVSAASQLRLEGARRLDFPLVRNSPWIFTLRRLGFFTRESSPVMAWEGRPGTPSVTGKLLLLAGDSES